MRSLSRFDVRTTRPPGAPSTNPGNHSLADQHIDAIETGHLEVTLSNFTGSEAPAGE
jgi:hypothetical protein